MKPGRRHPAALHGRRGRSYVFSRTVARLAGREDSPFVLPLANRVPGAGLCGECVLIGPWRRRRAAAGWCLSLPAGRAGCGLLSRAPRGPSHPARSGSSPAGFFFVWALGSFPLLDLFCFMEALRPCLGCTPRLRSEHSMCPVSAFQCEVLSATREARL